MHNPSHPGLIIRDDVLPELQLSVNEAAEQLSVSRVTLSRVITAGVPLQSDEGADFMTFRVGLFGLEKWHQVDRAVGQLAGALDRIGLVAPAGSASSVAPTAEAFAG